MKRINPESVSIICLLLLLMGFEHWIRWNLGLDAQGYVLQGELALSGLLAYLTCFSPTKKSALRLGSRALICILFMAIPSLIQPAFEAWLSSALDTTKHLWFVGTATGFLCLSIRKPVAANLTLWSAVLVIGSYVQIWNTGFGAEL